MAYYNNKRVYNIYAKSGSHSRLKRIIMQLFILRSLTAILTGKIILQFLPYYNIFYTFGAMICPF